MGTKQSTQFSSEDFNIEKYKFIRKQHKGVIIYDQQQCEQLFLRQFSYINRQQYEESYKKLQSELQREQNENVIKLLKIFKKSFHTFCSNSFKIYAIFQSPEISLEDQIKARIIQRKKFQQQDLWSIIQSCIYAFQSTQNYISLDPKKLYILSDGLVKIVNNSMVDDQFRSIVDDRIYYAPEKIENFKKDSINKQLEKQRIFSMGMTVLQAALLKSMQGSYDYKNLSFIVERLQNYLLQLTQFYSDQFVQLMSGILQVIPQQRSTLYQIQDKINFKLKTEQSKLHTYKAEQVNQFQFEDLPRNPLKKLDSNQLSISGKVRESLQNNKKQTTISEYYKENSNGKQFIKSDNKISSKTLAPYMPPVSSCQYLLFTDPRLLQMMRKDLRQLNQIKRSLNSDEISNFQFISHRPSGISEFNTYNNTYVNSQNNSRRTSFYEVCNIQSQEKTLNGRYYEGNLVQEKKQGYGKLLFADGGYYEGTFHDDKMHGHGTLYYSKNKPAYSGNWHQNKFHGSGILYNKQTTLLQNSFDYRNFQTVQQYWIKYEGQFVNDNKNGKGILTLSNGQTFEGQCKNDSINGQGTFRNIYGNKIKGYWINNKLEYQIQ